MVRPGRDTPQNELLGGPGGGGRGEGGLTKFNWRGSASRSNPLPFEIPFWEKRYPFYIPFIAERYPFHMPTCNSYE